MDTNTKRRRPSESEEDKNVFDALQAVEGYNPSDSKASIASIEAKWQEVEQLKAKEIQKKGEYKAARDNYVKADHDFHTLIISAKNQVRAQFGIDSNELQSLGLKKKTEYKNKKKSTTRPNVEK